eukprot:INCI4095.1.p1 GENE.INCI4095.1~~INCI4095.1.p1  ORF type:complete len:575 (+),score=81.77 INCI4095.1:114-1838(+)
MGGVPYCCSPPSMMPLSVGICRSILSVCGAAALFLAGTAGGERQLVQQDHLQQVAAAADSFSDGGGIQPDASASLLLVPHFANTACGSGHRGELSCINPKGSGLVCDRRHCLYYDQLVLSKGSGFRIAVRSDGRIQIQAETCVSLVNASACDASTARDRDDDGSCASPESGVLPEGLERVQHTWDIVATCGQIAADPQLDSDRQGQSLAAAIAPTPSSAHAVFFADFSNFINYYHFTVDCLLPLVTLLFDLGLVELDMGPNLAAAASGGDRMNGGRRQLAFRHHYQLIGAAQKSWRGRLDLHSNVFERPGTFYNAALSYVAHPDFRPRGLFFQKAADFPSSSSQAGTSSQQAVFGFEFALPSSQQSFNLDGDPPLSRERISELAEFESASFGMPYLWEDLIESTTNREGPAAPSLARDSIRDFAAFLHAQTNAVRLPVNGGPRVGIIHRQARRRILNEDDLVAVGKELDIGIEILHFEKHSFAEQVNLALNLDVLIGMNGAGLINALYLPPHAVSIQLVPFGKPVNFDEFGALLAARGPYLEWHNTIKAGFVCGAGFCVFVVKFLVAVPPISHT